MIIPKALSCSGKFPIKKDLKYSGLKHHYLSKYLSASIFFRLSKQSLSNFLLNIQTKDLLIFTFLFQSIYQYGLDAIKDDLGDNESDCQGDRDC